MEENKDVLAELNDADLEDVLGGKLGAGGAAALVLSAVVVASAVTYGIVHAATESKLKPIRENYIEMTKLQSIKEKQGLTEPENARLQQLLQEHVQLQIKLLGKEKLAKAMRSADRDDKSIIL